MRLLSLRRKYETDSDIHRAVLAALRRASLAEVCPQGHGTFPLEYAVLCETADQLVVVRMWRMLCLCYCLMDVHYQEFSFQHGLSYDIPKLCIRNVCRNPVFPGAGATDSLVRGPFDHLRLLLSCKIKSYREMKRIMIVLGLSFLACLSAIPVVAQIKATPAQQKSMIAAINRTAIAVKSIQSTFVQTKTMSFMHDKMTSKGVMYYSNGGKLRWEYTSPYQYIFVINDNKVYIKSGNKAANAIDVRQSRIFKSITQVMMYSVTGKGLASNRDFGVTMYVNGNEWIASLTPKRSEMKKMFKTIKLFFDKNKGVVSQVEMNEVSGDKTVIQLYGVKTNAAINEKVFRVN
jgi:outer membrane lipoprotein-sorting protein